MRRGLCSRQGELHTAAEGPRDVLVPVTGCTFYSCGPGEVLEDEIIACTERQ